MKRILLITLFLTGCITHTEDFNIINNDIIYVGDSLCWKAFDTDKDSDLFYDDRADRQTAQNMAGIRSNCKGGRKLMDLEELPKGYRITYLALVTNDVGKTNIDEFRVKYEDLVYNSDSEIIYCVLPNTKIYGKDTIEYRNVIESICSNVINPRDYGVRFMAKDTVHMTAKDHKLYKRALIERL